MLEPQTNPRGPPEITPTALPPWCPSTTRRYERRVTQALAKAQVTPSKTTLYSVMAGTAGAGLKGAPLAMQAVSGGGAVKDAFQAKDFLPVLSVQEPLSARRF